MPGYGTITGMIKNFISPLQSWLLTQNRCVGCGMPLDRAEKRKGKKGIVVSCKCKRMYIYDEGGKSYRRALLTEVS